MTKLIEADVLYDTSAVNFVERAFIFLKGETSGQD